MSTAQESAAKRQTLNLRIESEERDLIDRAARIAGKNRTEFILDASQHAAEETLLDRALPRLSPDAFAAFEARLDAPLRKTMRSRPPWDTE